jgi:hypothetical protein
VAYKVYTFRPKDNMRISRNQHRIDEISVINDEVNETIHLTEGKGSLLEIGGLLILANLIKEIKNDGVQENPEN